MPLVAFVQWLMLIHPSSGFTSRTFLTPLVSRPSTIKPVVRPSKLDVAAIPTDDGPSLDDAMAAAVTIQTLLDKELIKPPSIRSEQTTNELLNNLHSIALTLMEFDDTTPMERAAELFQYSLDNFDDDPAVRERLSAVLRTLGQLDKSANELFRVISALESNNSVDETTLCMLYLDLGFLIDDMLPLPGSGYELVDSISSQMDAPKFSLVDDTVSLSSFDCYRKAIKLDAECGLAHKKMADALITIGQTEEATKEFEMAAKYMPNDICCATHLHFTSNKCAGKGLNSLKEAIYLAKHIQVGNKLEDISANVDSVVPKISISKLAAQFETNGVLVLPRAIPDQDVKVLLEKVDQIIFSATDSADEGTVSDLTDETKSPKQRVHKALPLTGDVRYLTSISKLLCRLYPLLASILQCNEGGSLPLIGSGFMQTSPGASAQDLHKDVHHWDRHQSFSSMPQSWDCKQNGYPRCISIQIQLTDTTSGGEMGSLQVLPGSHRPDTGISSSDIAHAMKDPTLENGVIPVNVAPGTVTIYSSRLWHGGGANRSKTDRKFCFFTVTEDDIESAPPGLIHTMQLNDIGKWYIGGQDGLIKK